MTTRIYIHPHDPEIEVVDILDEGVLVRTYNRWNGSRNSNYDLRLTLRK